MKIIDILAYKSSVDTQCAIQHTSPQYFKKFLYKNILVHSKFLLQISKELLRVCTMY